MEIKVGFDITYAAAQPSLSALERKQNVSRDGFLRRQRNWATAYAKCRFKYC